MNTIELNMPATSELEDLVLGEMLSFSSVSDIEAIAEILKEDMFSGDNAKKLWRALLDECRKGQVPDSVTIAHSVGMDYVAKVMTATVADGVSPLNSLRHAAALHDRYVHKQAYMAAYEMMRAACDETSSVADMLSIPSRFIQQVQSESNIGFAQDLKDMGNIYAEILEKGMPGCVTTGFPKLDKLFRGGFPKGTLSILAGRPGHGKTSIGCFMMKKAATSGAHSVMISLEQKNIDIYEKLMYGTGRVTPEEVDRRQIPWSEYEKGVAELEQLPVFLIDIATTIEDIIYYIITLNHHRKCDIAFIDYLGLIPVKTDKGKTFAQAVGEVTRSLKCLAMQLNIPIILMCQLNRDSAKESRMPALTDLRDSGSIEQDADKVIMIQKSKDHVDMAIRKNRQGLGGDLGIKLVSDSVYCNFSEVEMDNELQ